MQLRTANITNKVFYLIVQNLCLIAVATALALSHTPGVAWISPVCPYALPTTSFRDRASLRAITQVRDGYTALRGCFVYLYT